MATEEFSATFSFYSMHNSCLYQYDLHSTKKPPHPSRVLSEAPIELYHPPQLLYLISRDLGALYHKMKLYKEMKGNDNAQIRQFSRSVSLTNYLSLSSYLFKFTKTYMY